MSVSARPAWLHQAFPSAQIGSFTHPLFTKDSNISQLCAAGIEEEESGWKYIHGDVFRFPPLKNVFCAFIGTGTQVNYICTEHMLVKGDKGHLIHVRSRPAEKQLDITLLWHDVVA
jgi:hypothetical protein